MPIRRSPNGAGYTRPQPGRDPPEWVVAINRNGWSQSIVIGGRNQPVRPAEPQHCVCTFIGTKDAYQSYRAILAQPIPQPDDVAPDYKTQVSSLLEGDPVDMLGNPPYAAEYFRNYY